MSSSFLSNRKLLIKRKKKIRVNVLKFSPWVSVFNYFPQLLKIILIKICRCSSHSRISICFKKPIRNRIVSVMLKQVLKQFLKMHKKCNN